MPNLEKLRSFNRTVLLSVPLFAITLTGCASDSDGTPQKPADRIEAKEKAKEDAISKSPKFETTYYPNGTRLLDYKNVPKESYFQSILQICDGLDLIEQTDSKYADGVGGAERSVNHPACADGKLSPEDFKIKISGPVQDN